MGNWRYYPIGRYRIKIDSEDFERVSQHTWRIRTRHDSQKLAIVTTVRTAKGVRMLSLGRFLMKPPRGYLVYPRRHMSDLDYRKENLIVCTIRERQRMLPKKRKDTSSSYKGVSYSKKDKKWRAGITVQGRSINLGHFKSEESAALAYNKASLKYFGQLGYRNTIERKTNRRK